MKKLLLQILLLILLPASITFAQQEKVIGIYFKVDIQKLNEDERKRIIDEITFWEFLLMENKLAYDVIDEEDFDEDQLSNYNCLLIPPIKISNTDEKELLKNYLLDGGSIYSMMGDENEDLLEELFNLKYEGKIFNNKITFYHSISAESPFIRNNTNNLLQISASFEPSVYSSVSSSVRPLGFIEFNEDLKDKSSLIFYGKNLNGRFIQNAIPFNSIVGGKDDLKTFSEFILKSFQWLQRTENVWIQDQNTSQALVLLDLTTGINLSKEFLELILRDEINPIANITDNSVSEKFIQNVGDKVNYSIDLRSEVQINNKQFEEKIYGFLNKIKKLFGISIQTALISNDQLNSIELNKLKENGIKNIIVQGSESIYSYNLNNELTILPFNKSLNTQNILELKGLVTFIYSADFDCEGDPEEDFLLRIKKYRNDIKPININDSNFYSSLNDNVQVEIIRNSENEIRLRLVNKSDEIIYSNKIILDIKADKMLRISSIISFNQNLDYSYDPELGYLDINPIKLQPNESRTLTITFSNE